MRKIKFRSFLKSNGKMLYDFTQLSNNVNTDDELRVLMQYTGLKDKNGTEIYEGDIIECLREGNGFVTKVYGAYGIETIFGFYPFIELFGELEVIGNIYEHPHLI